MLHLSPLFTFSVYWSDGHFSWYEYLWNRTWLRANMWTFHISWLTERIPWFRFAILLSFVNSLCRSGSHPTERVSSIQIQICRYSRYECLEKGKRNGEKCASCGVYVSSEDECIYVWREWKDTWTGNLIRFHHLKTPLQHKLGLNRPLCL